MTVLPLERMLNSYLRSCKKLKEEVPESVSVVDIEAGSQSLIDE